MKHAKDDGFMSAISTKDGIIIFLSDDEDPINIERKRIWSVYQLCQSYFDNFGAEDELGREVMWPQHTKYKVEVSLRKELILITPMALTFGTMIYGFSQGSVPFILASMGLAALSAFLAIKMTRLK